MKFHRIIFFSFLVGGVVVASSVQAVGLGVKPKKLEVQARSWQTVQTEFLVMNVSQEPGLYQVYADGLENKINFEPTEFKLEPGSSQVVKLTVKSIAAGIYSTNISVVARPLGSGGLISASGVKLPLVLTITRLDWFLVLAFGLVCLLVGYVVLWILRTKRRINNNQH
ncbi:MAG: hypothetical protein RB292_03200 [Patescibacteria group bacterium]|jgi:hypothetical protein|nr:hypothetical protein [Patescibacteria group bacterium]